MVKVASKPPLPPSEPTVVNLRDALEERYLAYALSTIMGRALPDARDGLKPVHRRILYGMQVLRLDPATAFKKCAKIVGDVMGDFHPHGDQAIYDALVRLAQDFSSRYPLVDGQGNFGNIDGDPAAAYRYTEARMTDFTKLLLDGIEDDTVDLRDNYSGDKQEPVVLPAAFPNLLANGAQGIAVGMATSIPPHNIVELCDAALHLIAHPDSDHADLVRIVIGPDFPTGGICVDEAAVIAENYRMGRGSFRLRARWAKEDGDRGTWSIVVTEIPYGVQKSRLIERLAEVITEKKSPLVADVRDESAEDIRVVIEPRSRSVDPHVMMEHLFRLTDLETRVPLNMNVLVDGVVPRVVGLGEALKQWLDHRRVVLVRRSRHRLAEIERRLEVLAGMLIVFLNLDAVIRIIREEDDPKASLKATFALSDIQADYVLDTRLRSLRRLEEMQLQKENEKLTREKQGLEALITSEAAQWKTVSAQIREVKKRYGADTPLGRRRTIFEALPGPRCVGNRPELHRARAGYDRRVRKGMDPYPQGPCRRYGWAHVQGRRPTVARLLHGNDGPDRGAGHGWQGLYAGRRKTAGRSRLGRADAPHGRPRRGRGCRGRAALRGKRQGSRRVERWARVPGRHDGSRGRDQERQGADLAGRGLQGQADDPGRRRSRRRRQ